MGDPPTGTRSSDGDDRERYDVIVIGGGQAGLAIGYYLKRQGVSFAILEATEAVGAAWRSRWDSLVLFTPRRYSALRGLSFRGWDRRASLQILNRLPETFQTGATDVQRSPFKCLRLATRT